MRIKHKILLVLIILLLGTCATFTAIFYQTHKRALLAGIDANLLTAAHMTRATLPADYHDRIVDESSVSQADYLRIIDRHNRLCQQLGLEYVWSLMMWHGQTVFTSATSTSKVVSQGDHARFLEVHSNPEAYREAFSTFEVQYQSIEDEWGNLRTVLVPGIDDQGRLFLFGASMKTEEIEALLAGTLRQALLIGAIVLLVGLLAGYVLANTLARPIRQLTRLTEEVAAGKTTRSIDFGTRDEIGELAQTFNRMFEERRIATEKQQESMSYLQNMERVSAAIVRSTEPERMIDEVLGETLEIFGCDRVWLLDPGANASAPWTIPFERTRPGCPGVAGEAREISRAKEITAHFEQVLAAERSIQSSSGAPELLAAGVRNFDTASQMLTRIAPRQGHPWLLGIQQCYHERTWSEAEQALFGQIAGRIADAMGSLLLLRELREREERFRVITENTTDVTFIVGRDGRFSYVSPSVERVIGRAAEEVEGKPATYYLHPEDISRVTRLLSQAMREPNTTLTEESLRIRHADGHYMDWDGLFIGMPDVPVVDGVVINCRDVSERRVAEELFSRVFYLNPMPASITVMSDSRIVKSNAAFAELVGMRCDDMIGRTTLDLGIWSEPRERGRLVQELRRTGSVQNMEAQIRTTDGEIRICLISSERIEFGDEPHVLSLAIDITDQKRIERALTLSNTALQRSNEDLENLAHVASHELKLPLRTANECARALYESHHEGLDNESRARLTTLIDLTRSMETRVDSLLEFARCGRNALRLEEVDLNEIVAEVLDSLAPRLHEREIEVRCPGSLPTVRCDRARVCEVFYHLIDNASTYNDKSEKWIEIGIRPAAGEDGADLLYVGDNGVGINENDMQTAFRVSRRLPADDLRANGLGIGLTIVKRFVERHGGRIDVESEPGEGSIFLFSLPVEASPPPDH